MKIRVLAIAVLLGSSVLALNSQSSPPAATEPAASAPATQASVDPAKAADIRKLMQLTGADALSAQMITTMEAHLRPNLVNAFPPGAYRARLIDVFFEKLSSKIGTATTDLTISVYDKYFSDEEIQQLTAFYLSPIGAKTIKVLPQLMNEITTTSQDWAQQLGQNCMQEVFQEHPDLKLAMERAESVRKFRPGSPQQ